jgi:hypothetical protein
VSCCSLIAAVLRRASPGATGMPSGKVIANRLRELPGYPVLARTTIANRSRAVIATQVASYAVSISRRLTTRTNSTTLCATSCDVTA